MKAAPARDSELCEARLPATLRPRDRVLEYLRAEFDHPHLKHGKRLPTVRRLASHLKVSSYTVHQVFAQLAREGRIRAEVGNGTFVVSDQTQNSDAFRLGLNLHLEKGTPADHWSYRIGGGIFHAAMHAPKIITLVSLSKQVEQSAELEQKLLADMARVDGLILLPLLGNDHVQTVYERAGKPVVELNPPTVTSTSNFVSSDFYGASLLLGEAWRRSGRRRIALLVSSPPERVSQRLRYAGLANGLDPELGRSITLRSFVADGWHEEDGYRVTLKLLDDGERPDAIYCAGDLLALGAIRALREKGLNIPGDVSVVGGTGLALAYSDCPGLTRTDQQCEKLGEELVVLMCQRIEQRGASVPGRFLPAPFMGGATTRPEENEWLKVGHGQPHGVSQ